VETVDLEEDEFGDDDLISPQAEMQHVPMPKPMKSEIPEFEQKLFSLNFSQIKIPQKPSQEATPEASKEQPQSKKSQENPREKSQEKPQGMPANEANPQRGFDRPVRSSTPEQRYHKPSWPIHKWEVKFRAETRNFAVLDFIKRVRSLAKAQRVSGCNIVRLGMTW
jgi:hypothetical protein